MQRTVPAERRLPVRADCPRPIVIASYARPRGCPNLTPLLALLLERYRVPVLVHGPAAGRGRRGGAASWQVLRELDILPARSLACASARMAADRLAYVETSLLAPALGGGAVTAATRMAAALLDPFGGAGVRVLGATDARMLAALRAHLEATAADALLLRATGGEPFADPRRPPRIEWYRQGVATVMFAARPPEQSPERLPAPGDAAAIADWTAGALAGRVAIPGAILDELACCVHAAGSDGAAAEPVGAARRYG